LDNRKIWVRSAHSALNTKLQGAAAVVMKKALVLFANSLEKDVKIVANVHDEWQVECDASQGKLVGKLGVDAIIEAGNYYKLNCPLDGEYKLGNNWSETH
jgi:DNA polymerase I-like protein with 3'-5' exonuclease and polymerase domains